MDPWTPAFAGVTSIMFLGVSMSLASSAKPNRLIREKSPYLLQHAYNPVDWYPWGSEAFEKARKENKPILVSIGYSTCHWCHVMERESYEDPQVAELMNTYLINIKVDREERPDVDKIYMTAVSAMTGSGGWPLNAFLTTDLKPFFGGTYFPPQAKWGQPAWKEVVTRIGASWQNAKERQRMLEAGNHITEALKKYTEVSQTLNDLDPAWLEKGFKALQVTYDAGRGGFGSAPKFPMPVYHNFLLRYWARIKASPPAPLPTGEGGSDAKRRETGEAEEALQMSLHTLREMANGGIYDHLGGGFARYSTDADWRIPHFEKMLYDNAQVTVNYLDAYQMTREEEYKRVAREILAYIQRDMTHPEGGFYSAEDADSLPSADAKEKKEGAFYVWERQEVVGIAGDKAGEMFCFRYGVKGEGNAAQDPHGEFRNKNILYVAHSLAETARRFAMTESETLTTLDQAKKKLTEARSRLPRPHLDDKIISGWNGLMISAFARAHQVLGDPDYLEAARRAARFLKDKLYDDKTRILYRRWREGERQVQGIADDYAFVVQGLIDLYEADFDPAWLTWAIELTEAQNQRFYDAKSGGYFMTAEDQDKHLLLRLKENMDNVEPSASSVAALNLLRLAQYTDRKDFQEAAEKTLKGFGTHLKESPRALPQMLVALDFALTEARQIVIAGKPGAPDTEAMLGVLHKHFIPVKTVMLADGGPLQAHLAKRLPFLEAIKPLGGKATAYVCVRHTCKQPTNDLRTFEKLLTAL